MLPWQRFSQWQLAHKLWDMSPEALSSERQCVLEQQLASQWQLEQAVVDAALQHQPVLSEALTLAVADSLEADLGELRLSEADRQSVIVHHTLMEWQMEQVSALVSEPTLAEVNDWYQRHADRFCRPEQRLARHLLLTVDGGEEKIVKAQILTLWDKLTCGGETFAALAERYSQCPTAMQGGELGWVSRGLLFAPLELTLFSLPSGALSEPVATDLGWHLLLCEAVRSETPLTREEALPKVFQHLLHQRKKQQQRAWLRRLMCA
ncbi:nitrogen fixation protein NifM [Pectobacterium sp. B2J-2]|uniref:nitrogen fixation protein NifM n=1 Tax=Pectobacterium sp. B2J-2 TaxID=3385372 RepID=UPI0038FCA27F